MAAASTASPVLVSGAARAATPSVARPRAGYADVVPAQLRAAARSRDWKLIAELARKHSGHSALRNGTSGHTLLHLAAAAGAADACSALVQGGADPDARDARGATPLHLAASGGHAAAVRALIEVGAELRRNDAGKTPLHDAAWVGHADTLAALVPAARAAGLIDAVGEDGRAAIHCASLSTDPALADTLLGAGADPDLVDKRGRSALDWANDLSKASGSDKVARRLRGAGARPAEEIDPSVAADK